MYTFNHNGCTITDHGKRRVSLWLNYEHIGDYATIGAAKRAANMMQRKRRAEHAAEHHAFVQAIVARGAF